MAAEPNAQRARRQLQTLTIGALYLVSTAAVIVALNALMKNPMAATVLGAAAVSMIAARADVKSERMGVRAGKRMAWGVLVAAVAAIAGTAAAVAGGASLAFTGIGTAAFYGFAEAVAVGYGREMWLRGISLTFAERAGVPMRWAFVFASLAGAAAVALEPHATPVGVLLTLASSMAFTALWIRGKDGYGAVVAHIAWVWFCDAALAGELFDLRNKAGRLTAHASAHGTSAIVAAVAFAVCAFVLMRNLVPYAAVAATDFEEPNAAESKATSKTKKKRKKRPNKTA